ncbi:MAG: HlyD family efflux transporter periplasmic adaptor subunit, partial [Tannerella sp.]|jgi:multidrug efflux pump subunit AcrA (membrane-fusion protein)|nr:HlyD family efflux transporter periplasmic adaptor subunit [Tannerella sp.]
MEQSGELQIVSSVSENYVPYIKVGDAAIIELKSLNMSIDGKISELSPSSFGTGGNYSMKLTIDAKDKGNIRPGMYANILIPNKAAEENPSNILLEASSLIYRDQLTGVYVVDDRNQAHLRWVRLGKTLGNQVEAISGLRLGERVVLKTEGKLYNGVKVSESK